MDRGKYLADLPIDEELSAGMRDRHGGIRLSTGRTAGVGVRAGIFPCLLWRRSRPLPVSSGTALVVLAPLMPPATRLFYLLGRGSKRGRGRGVGPPGHVVPDSRPRRLGGKECDSAPDGIRTRATALKGL